MSTSRSKSVRISAESLPRFATGVSSSRVSQESSPSKHLYMRIRSCLIAQSATGAKRCHCNNDKTSSLPRISRLESPHRADRAARALARSVTGSMRLPATHYYASSTYVLKESSGARIECAGSRACLRRIHRVEQHDLVLLGLVSENTGMRLKLFSQPAAKICAIVAAVGVALRTCVGANASAPERCVAGRHVLMMRAATLHKVKLSSELAMLPKRAAFDHTAKESHNQCCTSDHCPLRGSEKRSQGAMDGC